MIKSIIDKQLFLKKIFLVILDFVIVVVASILGLLLRFDLNINNHFFVLYASSVMSFLPLNIAITLLVFYFFRLYHSLWTYAGITELCNIFSACVIASIMNCAGLLLMEFPVPRSYYFLYMGVLFVMVLGSRFAYRLFRNFFHKPASKGKRTRVMIIGGGEATNIIIKEIKSSDRVKNTVVACVIDDDLDKQRQFIQGIKVVGTREKIVTAAEHYHIDEIIIAMPSVSRKVISEIVVICKLTNCKLKILPGIYQLMNGEVSVSKLRSVEIEDLLGRDPIKAELCSIMNYVKNKVVMVTGGGGSIGSELCRQVASYQPKQLIIVDIYENNAYDIQQEIKTKYPELNLVVLIASVRNALRIDKIFDEYRPNIVYHAAAHKHVPLMEASPNEAIKNNVFGTLNTVLAADKYHCERFVMISTDKAVNPTNIMGASKRICEMIIQTYNKKSKTEYVAVRFGNVLGSNGSVIPLFKRQIAAGGPVTVTHPDIIRYFMTIPEAVSLVLQAGATAKGGEIFVLDMGEPMRIYELAENLIRLSGYKPNEDIMIEITGLRPGEKLYEELLMKEEGLQDTENKLIHIGKPIAMDEVDFLEKLEALNKACNEETSEIKEQVKRIVPTYVIDKKS